MIRTEFDPIDYQQLRDQHMPVLQIDRREARQLVDSLMEVESANLIGELSTEVDGAQGEVSEPGKVAYVILRIVHSEV